MNPKSEHSSTTILTVLVGSRAHGLSSPSSDTDSRSVFVIPTSEMFHIGYKYKATRQVKEDHPERNDMAWEVGLFLELAVECHPLILETFLSPITTANTWGEELRTLFPAVWSPVPALRAFRQYAVNQRKKFLEKKDGRPAKYGATYVRVLYNLVELLETGTFTIRIVDTPMGDTIADIKQGKFSTGQIIDLGEELSEKASGLVDRCQHRPELERINEFSVRIRTAFLS